MKTVLLSLAGVLSAAFVHASVVIDFSGMPGATNAQIGATFASAVPDSGGVTGVSVTGGAGAPDVTLGWSQSSVGGTQWQFYNSWSTLGSVAQLDNAAVGASYDLTFTPGATTAVMIESFDLAVFAGFSQDVVWSVFATGSPGTVLSTNDSGLVTGGQDVTQNVRFAGATGVSYTLRLTRAAGGSAAPNALAVDNIVFSAGSPVPEPGAWGLLAAAGLGAGAAWRRRNKRSAPPLK